MKSGFNLPSLSYLRKKKMIQLSKYKSAKEKLVMKKIYQHWMLIEAQLQDNALQLSLHLQDCKDVMVRSTEIFEVKQLSDT